MPTPFQQDKKKPLKVQKKSAATYKSAMTLAFALAVYWFSLSGYFNHALLYVVGVLSIAFVVGLCARMNIIDEESAPYSNLNAFVYFGWLFREIATANVKVLKVVMDPDRQVSPQTFTVAHQLTSDIAQTSFANSITLTPGTVCLNLNDESVFIHALDKNFVNPQDIDAMQARVAKAFNHIPDSKKL